MSALDLKALREIAEKATPGPWKTVSSHVYRMGEDGANVCSASDPWVSTIVGYYKPQIDSQKGLLKAADNAAYIAAVNPATALALLDRIEEQEREIERLRAERQWQPIETAPRDGTPILIGMKRNLPFANAIAKEFAGLQFVASHPGILKNRFDVGWNFAAPVGVGGFPDEWIAGWRPLDPTPIAEPPHD